MAALSTSLASFVDDHPLAHHFVVDAGQNWKDIWLVSPTTKAQARRRLWRGEKAASIRACALTHLSTDVDSFLLAISSAHLLRDQVLANRLLTRAIQVNGDEGYSAALLLWVAFAEQSNGKVLDAVATYRTAARSSLSQIRRGALASGAFAAADAEEHTSLLWFLDQMADEDPDHQRRIFRIVATLRTNRAGRQRTATLLRRIRESLNEGHVTARWVRETGIV